MLKFIGILAVLYVYYREIDAVAQKLEFWEPTTEYAEGRRAHSARKKLASVNKTDRIRLRSQDLRAPKYTMGFRADIKEVIHYPKHGKPHIEPALRNGDHNSDSEHPVDKTNRYKKRNRDDIKKQNDEDTKRKPNIDKSQSKEIKIKNRETEKNKSHNKDKRHKKDRTHNIEENQNQEMTDENEKKNMENNQSVEKDKDKNVEDSKHSKDNNQEIDDKQTPKKKTRTRVRHREQQHIDLGKDVNRIGGPMKIPKLHPEPIQGRVETHKWPVRHHKSKLRSHKKEDEAHIRSTRMAPLSLMQQDEDGGGGGEQKVQGGDGGSPPSYLSPYAIMSQMKQIMEDFPEANATFEKIARTVEYNDIIILKITQKKHDLGKYFRAEESKYIDEVPEKKILFIVHGLSVMGMSHLSSLVEITELKLLMSYYLKHLDKFDIYLIPMANPDGYSFSHSPTHGMWNKNVSPQDACPGVCLDRNFDVAWNATRLISSCSQLYPGPAPFSEIESKAVRDIFHYFGHKILAYINVHSGTFDDKVFKGDAILFPRGFTELQTDDDKYIDMRGEIDEAVKNASFQVISVTVDTLHNWYGKVSGASVDYACTVYGIPYALEFVMQLYSGEEENTSMSHYALTEIWSRLIDTTFNNMYKSLHINDVRRK